MKTYKQELESYIQTQNQKEVKIFDIHGTIEIGGVTLIGCLLVTALLVFIFSMLPSLDQIHVSDNWQIAITFGWFFLAVYTCNKVIDIFKKRFVDGFSEPERLKKLTSEFKTIKMNEVDKALEVVNLQNPEYLEKRRKEL